MKKYRAVSCALIAILTLSTAPAVAKTPKPTLAQIEAAKKAEAAKKKAADAQAAQLAAANQSLRTLTARANAATALYIQAQRELVIAERPRGRPRSMPLKPQLQWTRHIELLEN